MTEEGYILYDPSKSLDEQRDANLFPFPYDWRKPINEIADDLNKFINEKISDGTKINIIAHSMGGLVTKAYLYKYGSNQNIEKFIMVGTPNLGSPAMYETLRYTTPMLFPPVWGYPAKYIKIMARNLPSAYEVFPSKEYFYIDYLGYPLDSSKLNI